MSATYFADPLESEDFDSVSYINQRFPTGINTTFFRLWRSFNIISFRFPTTETSLDDLDSFIEDIGGQISTLDEVFCPCSVLTFLSLTIYSNCTKYRKFPRLFRHRV